EDFSAEGLSSKGVDKLLRALRVPKKAAAATTAQPPTAGPYRALLIGVSEFADPQLVSLNGPPNDLPLLTGALEEMKLRGGAQWEVESLPLNPDRNAIGAALEKLFVSEATGTLLFYYSGHGDVVHNDSYLYAADTKLDKVTWTAISAGQIVDVVAGCPAATRIVVLDCCHGAPIGTNDFDRLERH